MTWLVDLLLNRNRTNIVTQYLWNSTFYFFSLEIANVFLNSIHHNFRMVLWKICIKILSEFCADFFLKFWAFFSKIHPKECTNISVIIHQCNPTNFYYKFYTVFVFRILKISEFCRNFFNNNFNRNFQKKKKKNLKFYNVGLSLPRLQRIYQEH